MIRRFRILLIEDDQHRVDKFRSWLPSDVILAEVRSAGQAMGFLKRIQPGELSGILLDHDLQQQALTASDAFLSGSHLIDLIVQNVERDVAIFIHSTNPTGASSMATRLNGAGFWVTQRPMYALTQKIISEWSEDIRPE